MCVWVELAELSGEGVLCSGELESIVVPGVTVLVTSTVVSGELLVSSVQVLEVSALLVGLPTSVELELGVEGEVCAVRVELELDEGMGCAVSEVLSVWLSDEVRRGTVT